MQREREREPDFVGCSTLLKQSKPFVLAMARSRSVGYLAHCISHAKLPLWHHPGFPGWELSSRSRFLTSYGTTTLDRVFDVVTTLPCSTLVFNSLTISVGRYAGFLLLLLCWQWRAVGRLGTWRISFHLQSCRFGIIRFPGWEFSSRGCFRRVTGQLH